MGRSRDVVLERIALWLFKYQDILLSSEQTGSRYVVFRSKAGWIKHTRISWRSE